MKKLFLLMALALTVSANSIFGQVPFVDLGVGVRVGTITKQYSGSDSKKGPVLFGAQANIGISKFTLVPNYEYSKTSDAKINTINIDGQYEVTGFAVAKMFVGGGYVIEAVKPSGVPGASKPTNTGFNLQIGGKAGFGPFGIFGLAKMTRINVEDVLPPGNKKARISYALVIGGNFNLL